VPGTMRQLEFNGQTGVTIRVGDEVVSDPVQLTFRPLEDLAVSVFVPSMSGSATYHATAIQDSFVSTAGDFATTDSAASYPTTITCWMFADGVDVPDLRGSPGRWLPLAIPSPMASSPTPTPMIAGPTCWPGAWTH
jgi:hypothetical protein